MKSLSVEKKAHETKKTEKAMKKNETTKKKDHGQQINDVRTYIYILHVNDDEINNLSKRAVASSVKGV